MHRLVIIFLFAASAWAQQYVITPLPGEPLRIPTPTLASLGAVGGRSSITTTNNQVLCSSGTAGTLKPCDGASTLASSLSIGTKFLADGTVGIDTTSYLGGVLLSGLTGSIKLTAGVPSIAAAADIIALWSGTCNSDTLLAGNGACAAPSTALGTTDVISWSTLASISQASGKIKMNNAAAAGDGGTLRLNTLELSGAGAFTTYALGALGATNGSAVTGVTFYSGNPVVIGTDGAVAGSAKGYCFSSATDPYSAGKDTCVARNAAGVTEINTGTSGVYRDLVLRAITSGGWGAGTEGGCATATDLVVDGSNNKKVTSASYTFVAADVGGWVDITAGTGWTTGRYIVTAVAAGAATLASSPAAVSTTGGTFVTNWDKIVHVHGTLGATADTYRMCALAGAGVPGWTALL